MGGYNKMAANNTRLKHQSSWLAISTNFVASVLLAGVLGLGIYVNLTKIIISNRPTAGYSSFDFDTRTWNILCTVVGTVVGLLAALGFAMQDDHLTRRQLTRERGVIALFLRPLTMRRAAEQVWHLQVPFERTLLVFLTISTALSSAAVVALFGVRPAVDEIINPTGSYPLTDFNQSTSYSVHGADGGLLSTANPYDVPKTPKLSGFLYRAAYIHGRKMLDKYVPSAVQMDGSPAYMPEEGALGDTVYESTSTGGIGLNLASYMQYSGFTGRFSIPGQYEFSSLAGSVYGTHVNVTCRDVTRDYKIAAVNDRSSGVPDIRIISIKKPGGPNITLLQNQDWESQGLFDFRRGLAIASAVTIDNDSGEPTQTLVVSAVFDSQLPTVYECSYGGWEYIADISVDSSTEPVRMRKETAPVAEIGPFFKQILANESHSLISIGGNSGGNLAQGFLDSEYNYDGKNNTGMAQALGVVLGQVGEAYVSLLRQELERSNLDQNQVTFGALASEVHLFATVLRLGGGNNLPWLAVIGVMFLGTLFGTLRTCFGGSGAGFEAQDTVQLLRITFDNPNIRYKTRVSFKDDIVVIGDGDAGHWVGPKTPSIYTLQQLHSATDTPRHNR